MKIGIIGAGMTGLTAAYELSKAQHEIELFEAAPEIGGIAGTFMLDGIALEKYYHHFFKSDRYLVQLLEELALSDRIEWRESKMGFFTDGKSYAFGTPVSLLKFQSLGLLDKFRFGLSVLQLMKLSSWQELETVTAEAWLRKHAGNKAFEKIWKPLLITKFGEHYHDISMAWMWGKIKLRGASKEAGKEVLGYIEGSTKTLLDRMQHLLDERHVKTRLNCRVNSIIKKGQGLVLETDQDKHAFDLVISTVPLPKFLDLGKSCLPQAYLEQLRGIRYTSVVCSVLVLNKSFGPFYWLNIGDEAIPFGGLIEHTNLLDKSLYHDKHILYISNYLYSTDSYYRMSEDVLFKAYIPHLKRIKPLFKEADIEKLYTFKDEFAQPVITCGYSSVKPGFETPVENLYTAGMCHIYPEDRGMNYAVRDGKAIAREIGKGRCTKR